MGFYRDSKYSEAFHKICRQYFINQPTPWMTKCINTFFNFRRPTGDLARTDLRIWAPKKIGKSYFVSIVFGVLAMSKPNQELWICSANKKQSKKIWSALINNIKPEYKNLWWPQSTEDKLTFKPNGSTIELISSIPSQASGYNASGVAFEEIIDFRAVYAQEVFDKVIDSTMARNGLRITISTVGFDNTALWARLYRESMDVIEGKSRNFTLCPIVYQVPNDEDYKDIEVLKKYIPTIKDNFPVHENWYKDRIAILGDDPTSNYQFRVLHCNQVNVGTPSRWISEDQLEAIKTDRPESDFYGKDYALGLGCDFARRFDLTSFCVMVHDPVEDVYYAYPQAFVPKIGIEERERKDGFRYRQACEDKTANITLMPGNCTDCKMLRDAIMESVENFGGYPTLFFDPTNFDDSRQTLAETGLDCVEVKQDRGSMSPLYDFVETLIKQKRLRLPHDLLVDQHFKNVSLDVDARDRKMAQKTSLQQRVDIVDAIALSAAAFIGTFNDKGSMPPPEQNVCGELW